MARVRTAKHPKPERAPEPEDESQEPPEQEEEPETPEEPEGQRPIKKVDAVRAALAEGIDTPDEAVEFIRKRFGVEISKTHFSATKSQLKRREGESGGKPKGTRGGRAKKAEATEGYLAPPPAPPGGGQPDLLAAMEAMKPLVTSLGKDQVKRIVDLLG